MLNENKNTHHLTYNSAPESDYLRLLRVDLRDQAVAAVDFSLVVFFE
jgi:hypothetical protein